MVRELVLAAAVWIALSVAHAADLEDISMPDTRVLDGKPLSVQTQRGVPLGGWSRSRGDAAATAVQDATAMARRAKR